MVTLSSAGSRAKAAAGCLGRNESGCVPTGLYLWTLTFEFHQMFRVTKYYSCFDFCLPFKNMKIILSSWPTGSSVLASDGDRPVWCEGQGWGGCRVFQAEGGPEVAEKEVNLDGTP